jgi:hypothetical protein
MSEPRRFQAILLSAQRFVNTESFIFSPLDQKGPPAGAVLKRNRFTRPLKPTYERRPASGTPELRKTELRKTELWTRAPSSASGRHVLPLPMETFEGKLTFPLPLI